MSDQDLETLLLSFVIDLQRKGMFVITSAFEAIGHKSEDIRLWGSGPDTADPLVDRCIESLKRLASEGRIEAFGDLSRPRYSEVRRADR